MFTTKIFRVAYAITQAEGWYSTQSKTNYPLGSKSYRLHNPGNLRSSIYQITREGGFAVFENDMVGFFALVYQLTLYANGGSANVKPEDSIATAIAKYSGTTIATTAFNNYMSIIEKLGKVLRNDKIQSLLEE